MGERADLRRERDARAGACRRAARHSPRPRLLLGEVVAFSGIGIAITADAPIAELFDQTEFSYAGMIVAWSARASRSGCCSSRAKASSSRPELRHCPMDYFFYCRDNPGTAELRDQTLEAHWSFMDSYADVMIARGPTLADDRETATGSMHIVDLPDIEAVRVFAHEEPNYRVGVYRDVMVRRWRNVLGRTMWEFAGDPAGSPRFLIIGHGHRDMTTVSDALRDEHRRYLVDRGYDDRFIARGPLLTDDGSGWVGSALLVEMADRAAVEAMLADAPYTRAGLYADVEIHNWQFGGRPASTT